MTSSEAIETDPTITEEMLDYVPMTEFWKYKVRLLCR